MNDDLISRQAVIDLIMENDPFWCEGMTRTIFDGIDRLPSVDAVPVIRCKECKHYMNEDENYPDEYGNCPTVCMYMPDDAEENGYCHRAERREHEVD